MLVYPAACSISLDGIAEVCCSGASCWVSSQRRNASIETKNGGDQMWWHVHHTDAVSAFGSRINLSSEHVSVLPQFPHLHSTSINTETSELYE